MVSTATDTGGPRQELGVRGSSRTHWAAGDTSAGRHTHGPLAKAWTNASTGCCPKRVCTAPGRTDGCRSGGSWRRQQDLSCAVHHGGAACRGRAHADTSVLPSPLSVSLKLV